MCTGVRKAIILVGALLAGSGCAHLTITQWTFQGDPSRSIEDRLAMGRSIAEAIQKEAKIWEEGRFDKDILYPDRYALRDTLLEFAAATETMPPPADRDAQVRLAQALRELKGELNKPSLETRDLSAARGIASVIQKQLIAGGVWPPEDFVQRVEKIQIDFSRLFAFATQAEEKTFQPDKAALQERVRAKAGRLKKIIRYPGFDQIRLKDPHWEIINPVSVFGGLGKAEFIVVLDDTGNFSLKSAAFDPSQTAAAISNAAMSTLRIVAGAYGVPIPAAPAKGTSSATPASDATADQTLSAPQIQHQRDVARSLDSASTQLRERLVAIQGTLSASETKNIPPAQLTSLKGALEGHLQAVSILSRDVSELKTLQEAAK
jgi:hypothetical protein